MQSSSFGIQTRTYLQNEQYSLQSVAYHTQPQPYPQINNQLPQQSQSQMRIQSHPKYHQTIKIKAQRSQKNNQQIIKQCRICLQGQQQGRMVQPCLCSGSITYTHQKCLIEWIKHKHDIKSKIKLYCEMCHTQFNYKTNKRRKLDLQQFCINYQKQKCSFITFYIFVFVLLLVIVGLMVIIIQSGTGTQIGNTIKNLLMKSDNVKVIYICVVFILTIVLMFLFILFVIEYAVKSQIIITQVMDYCGVGITKKMRIHPKVNQNIRQRIQITPQ